MTFEEFAAVLARIDGRDAAIVDGYLVRMQAARIIGQGSAFGAGDLAVAVIGLNAAARAADAPAAVATFRAFPPRLMSGLESERYLPDAVIEAGNLGDAVEALIDTAPEIERAFEQFVFDALANDPASVLGGIGARVGMRLTLQFHTGPYPAAAIHVQSNLLRRQGYGRKQRVLESLHETVFVDPDLAQRGLDDQVPERRVSVALHLPVFLALREAVHCEDRRVPRFDHVAGAGGNVVNLHRDA